MYVVLKILLTALLFFQQTATNPPPKDPAADQDDVEYICPMDKNVRSKTPGKCPICNMTLVLNLPDAREYPVHITTKPKTVKPNEDVLLNFRIEEPEAGKT